jgi:gamma-glutamyl-gamma-aminobutyrate hydrolase PuuD
MNKRKIYVVGTSIDYMNWMQGELVEDMKDADLVVFTGGEDVSPKLYDSHQHYTTSCNSARDAYETGKYHEAKGLGIPCIGICRGAQFLCVMSGGKLIQHQSNPGSKHDLFTKDGRTIRVTSSHHQAQLPFSLPKEEYTILGWTENLSPFHKDGNNDEVNPEVECEDVIYHKANNLGIQSHPEWCYPPSSPSEIFMIDYYQSLLDKFLNKEL